MNSVALATFQESLARSSGQGRGFVNMQGEPLKGYKHWFDPAVREAGVSLLYLVLIAAYICEPLGMDLRTAAELMGYKTIQIDALHISRARSQVGCC